MPAGPIRTICAAALALGVLCSCGGGFLRSSPQAAATCGPPWTEPTPYPAWLAYPPSGSTNVATTIGKFIEKGASPGGLAIIVSSPSGNLPLGTPTAAPSPYPTPFVTPPPNDYVNGPYMAVPLPTLSPATTYTVSDQFMYWSNNPPQCEAPVTQFVGSFTTQ